MVPAPVRSRPTRTVLSAVDKRKLERDSMKLARTHREENTMNPIIRPYRPEDFAPINDLWRRARVAAFPDFHARKGHTAEEDRAYFRMVILIKNTVFVAQADGRVVGFIAIAGDFIDQLYVDPDSKRQNVGASLISAAKALSPSGLHLFTFETNASWKRCRPEGDSALAAEIKDRSG